MESPGDVTSIERLLAQRIILLNEEVTDDTARRIVSHLLMLSADDDRSDISLYINSPGGSVVAGLAIYDIMQLIPNDVATVGLGMAASMGQVLLCAGAAGKRAILANGQVLLHEGSAGLAGSAADVEIQAQQLRWTLERLTSIIAQHTGRPLTEVSADVGRDRWFDATESLTYGFVDRIATSLSDITPTPVTRSVGLTKVGA